MSSWKRTHKNSGYKKRGRRERALNRLVENLKNRGKKIKLHSDEEVPLYTDKEITKMEREVEILKSRL